MGTFIDHSDCNVAWPKCNAEPARVRIELWAGDSNRVNLTTLVVEYQGKEARIEIPLVDGASTGLDACRWELLRLLDAVDAWARRPALEDSPEG
jgi:hypothetical protein